MNYSLIFGIIISILIPLVLSIWWIRKSGVKFKAFVVGVLCFIIFAEFLESFAHQYFLLGDNVVSKTITSSPILYSLYACLAAGIFEETGRLFSFKYLLKKSSDKNDAIALGIGHGGIEIILVLTINYLIYALALTGTNFNEVTSGLVRIASSISFPLVVLALIERISAMALHIGLSMIVYVGSKKEGKLYFYFLAIVLHALSDIPAALYQTGILKSLILIEILIFIISISCLKYALSTFKKEFN